MNKGNEEFINEESNESQCSKILGVLLNGGAITPLEQEWSEKDKHILKNIHDFVKENTIDSNRVNCAEECLNWLKSLKPQTHWKPSDGQMKAIKYFIDFHRSQANASTEGWSEFKHLESLYNILKKL